MGGRQMKSKSIDELFIIGNIDKEKDDLYIPYHSYYYELINIVKRLKDYFIKEVA